MGLSKQKYQSDCSPAIGVWLKKNFQLKKMIEVSLNQYCFLQNKIIVFFNGGHLNIIRESIVQFNYHKGQRMIIIFYDETELNTL